MMRLSEIVSVAFVLLETCTSLQKTSERSERLFLASWWFIWMLYDVLDVIEMSLNFLVDDLLLFLSLLFFFLVLWSSLLIFYFSVASVKIFHRVWNLDFSISYLDFLLWLSTLMKSLFCVVFSIRFSECLNFQEVLIFYLSSLEICIQLLCTEDFQEVLHFCQCSVVKRNFLEVLSLFV